MGAEGWGWALDEQERLAREAYTDVVDFSSLGEAEVVHSVWWERIAAIPPTRLEGKRVLCNLDNPPSFLLTLPRFRHVRRVVSCWIARGREVREQCEALGLPHHFVPYPFDTRTFFPMGHDDGTVRALRTRLGVPPDAYVIGNFHRDSEGADLLRPKVQKGADVFGEIARLLRERGHPVHVLLAGPRRHFLRRRLTAYRVPYTFVGRIMAEDDLRENVLPRSELNHLYGLLDLCLVTSRWEGGPSSVAEAAATRCRIVSTRVGIALDILEPRCLYEDIAEAVALIEEDIATGSLRSTLDPQHERVRRGHGREAVHEALRALYERITDFAPFSGKSRSAGWTWSSAREPVLVKVRRKLLGGLGRPPSRPGREVISLVAARFDPFLRALASGLRARGVTVLANEIRAGVNLFIVSPPCRSPASSERSPTSASPGSRIAWASAARGAARIAR